MRPCQPSESRQQGTASRRSRTRAAEGDTQSPQLPPKYAPPASIQRYFIFLKKRWWFPVLSPLFFTALAGAYLGWWPDSYVAVGHLWAAGRVGLQLHEGTTYAEDLQNFDGTQVELLQSDEIQRRALARVRNELGPAVPTNAAGKPDPVKIRVCQIPKSAIIELKA